MEHAGWSVKQAQPLAETLRRLHEYHLHNMMVIDYSEYSSMSKLIIRLSAKTAFQGHGSSANPITARSTAFVAYVKRVT